ncbi:MAG: UxaA family hydrolase [Firmicutes bacterium]|nr:UxaA family hydrolase [Bacillota bacterium]MBR0113676.1 UxaA family hydrolase [Bacillota bacterium]
MYYAMMINEKDNVAMATTNVPAGEKVLVTLTGQEVVAAEDIKAGHKMALCDLKKGDFVIKYGIPIGNMKSDCPVGGMVHVHNLEDTTEELCTGYVKKYRESGRTMKVYPRANGDFGIRNYIMVFATTPEANALAEAISDATGCNWMVCNREELKDGEITDFTVKAMGYTGRNPNVYAALVVGDAEPSAKSAEVKSLIEETGKPVAYLGSCKCNLEEGCNIVKAWQKDAAAQERVDTPLDGFKIAVHCAASDWTTALTGNPAVGLAADHIVKNGGMVIMDEWAGFPGSEHLMAQKAVTRKLGLQIIDKVDEFRARYLAETGKPVEATNPFPSNIEGGITTLVEKSTGNIKKAGNTDIQGIIGFCEKPERPGVWLQDQPCGGPSSTAIYGALSGVHLNILITGMGYVYHEIPNMPTIRLTGNPETFKVDTHKLDFDAGQALLGKTLQEVGDDLFEYIISVAEGKDPKCEERKIKYFMFYYYYPRTAKKDPANRTWDYHDKMKAILDSIK